MNFIGTASLPVELGNKQAINKLYVHIQQKLLHGSLLLLQASHTLMVICWSINNTDYCLILPGLGLV